MIVVHGVSCSNMYTVNSTLSACTATLLHGEINIVAYSVSCSNMHSNIADYGVHKAPVHGELNIECA